ncbi:lipid-A-disaccharide synthase [[Phormidium] sp. LEGE 05292]|uniref:lipid-A-disaccharide synthase n=1 Tax=[Phormidium] sp. LEGE 05292 TaxID=767427 RepID=UPI001D142684|nr:lipid-A-disaccharide synthase [Phormidium sp. LEGE 05292]
MAIHIFISTGEVSGDLQGALLINALKRQAEKLEQELEIVALGGSRMAQAGATLLENTTKIGSVGILESLPYILPTLQIQNRTQQYLRQNPPDLVILIDYMGPNLVIGNFVRTVLTNVPVVYYIAPQVWVWSLSDRDTKQIIKNSDLILAIFPEEARFFAEKGVKVSWVGHPLLDKMIAAPTRSAARASLGIAPEETVITLVPASRRQELRYVLPVMLAAAKIIQTKIPEVKFLIPLSLEAFRQSIEKAVKDYNLKATLLADKNIEAIAASDLAITKSGTVNLEIALLDVPQVVIYRVNPITAWIAKKLLKFSIPFMSPPNLVLMKAIVPELLQEQATPENIVKEALNLLNPANRSQVLANYQLMRQSLGQEGRVCEKAAQEIFTLLP